MHLLDSLLQYYKTQFLRKIQEYNIKSTYHKDCYDALRETRYEYTESKKYILAIQGGFGSTDYAISFVNLLGDSIYSLSPCNDAFYKSCANDKLHII